MKHLSTNTVSYTLRDDGIVVGRAVNPEIVRTADDVAESFDRLDELIDGVRRPGLWDPREVQEFPPAAWRMLITRLERSMVALAILTDEKMETALGRFPEAIDALLIPVRLFRDEDSAIEWLARFVEQESESNPSERSSDQSDKS